MKKFIIMFLISCHCSLFWTRWIHSTPTQPIFTNYFSRQIILLEQFCILLYIPHNFLCI